MMMHTKELKNVVLISGRKYFPKLKDNPTRERDVAYLFTCPDTQMARFTYDYNTRSIQFPKKVTCD